MWKKDEIVNHIISRCCKQARKDYKKGGKGDSQGIVKDIRPFYQTI